MGKDNMQAKRVTRIRRSSRVAASLPLRLWLISSLLYFLVFHVLQEQIAEKAADKAKAEAENVIEMMAEVDENKLMEKEKKEILKEPTDEIHYVEEEVENGMGERKLEEL
ncbi:hypothetical protein E2C01_050874 [Portunus trituberculatus]|uniref:Uncharacterized protein n=1 Tax=Portunus trituberculatus TaxID=210409 RepID=A0A5B7GIP9_PORTR|nr:hypothetical protein [Portunus trituberculatus]